MSWPSATDGWALSMTAGGGPPSLLHTTDGGQHWPAAAGVDVADAKQVLFADERNGWLVTDEGVDSTHDGGTTWTPVTVQGGIGEGAAAATAGGVVHIAYATADASGVHIASSPVASDAFVASALALPFAAGPVLDVSMSAGGPYASLIYNDRVFSGAAQLRDGAWTAWDLSCPYANPFVAAGLSPTGAALSIACGPSGYGEPAPVVGANLSSGSLAWATIVAADAGAGTARVEFATATDAGVRLVGSTDQNGAAHIAASTDAGATWRTVATLDHDATFGAVAHLPDGGLVVTVTPSGGLISPDGLTWSPAPTGAGVKN